MALENCHPELRHQIDLASLSVKEPFHLFDGIGTDWKALQLGQPLDVKASGSINITIPATTLDDNANSFSLCISVVPMCPVATDRSNRFAVCVDGGKPTVCENVFKEWGREWKIQVIENRKEFVMTMPLDRSRREHVVTLYIIDPARFCRRSPISKTNI